MKAKFGAIVVDGRGKVGGHVFSKNRGGAYMRTKVTPANGQTKAQQARRASLTAFAQGFRALTASQITAWNNAVESFKSTNIFGDVKNPSGINLYVRLNTLLSLAGQANITDPPLPTAVEALTDLSAVFDASGQTAVLTFAPTPVPAGHTLIVEASKQFSPGVSAFKGKTRFVQSYAAATATGASIATAYIAKYGAIVEGQKIALRAYLIENNTGLKGTPLNYVVTVQA